MKIRRPSLFSSLKASLNQAARSAMDMAAVLENSGHARFADSEIPRDNNAALMGVVGAQYQADRPASPSVASDYSTGDELQPQDAADQSLRYKTLTAAMEQEKAIAAATAAYHDAVGAKNLIVQRHKLGKRAPFLVVQLQKTDGQN